MIQLFVDGFYKSAQLRILGVFPIDQAVGRELNADKGKLQRRFKKNGVQIQICLLDTSLVELVLAHLQKQAGDHALVVDVHARGGHADGVHMACLLYTSGPTNLSTGIPRIKPKKGASMRC